MADTMLVSKSEYLQLRSENKALRNTELYRRLLEFEQNISTGKVFTRADLGF